VQLVLKEQLETQDQLVRKELKVTWDQLDLRVYKVSRVFKVKQD
jgi:hypothetical protein